MRAKLRIAAFAVLAIVALLSCIVGVILATFDPNDYKGAIVERVFDKTHRKLTIAGDIKLAFYPRLGVELGKASLSEPNGVDQFASMDGIRLSLALLPLLRRQIVVDRIVLRGMQARLVRLADGRMNIDDLTAARTKDAGAAKNADAAQAKPISFAVNSIRVDNANFEFEDRKAGRTIQISRLNIDSGPLAHGVPSRLALSANIGVSEPALNTAIILSSDFSLDRDKRRLAFSALEASVDVAAKASGVNSHGLLKGSIDIDLEKDEVVAALKGKFDDSSVDLKAGSRAGAMQLALDIDKLDLARYRARPPATPAPASAPGEAGATNVIPDPPLDLSALATLRASGTVFIGELAAGGMHLSNVRAVLLADGGKVALDPVSATLYGGSTKGRLTLKVDAAGGAPRFALVQALQGVSLGALVRDLAGQSPIDGKGQVQLDISAEGHSVGALRRALAGTAAMQLRDGAINGLRLPEVLHGVVNPERTGFAELTASFLIAGGIARNDDLLATAPLLRTPGSGEIDLAQAQIAYALSCNVADGKVIVPVSLSGPLAKMHWKADLKGSAVEELKQKVGDKLKDRLKDLFKKH